jgi:hypothetical protein
MEKTVKVNHNDKEHTLLVISPTSAINREAEKVYNQTLIESIRNGLPVVAEIDEYLEKRFPIEQERREKDEIISLINRKQKSLYSGKDGDRKLTKVEGRTLAIEIMDLRDKLSAQNVSRASLYNSTAERFADIARTNYLLYLCILNSETRKPFFVSYEDYEDHKDSEIILEAVKAFREVTNITYKNDEDPEVKWLKKYKFMNDEGYFINAQGKRVDAEYRLVDPKGRYINEAGEYVDKFGNRIDEAGELVIEVEDSAYSE